MKHLYEYLIETFQTRFDKNDLINFCNLSQSNLYNIFKTNLELLNYKVYNCEQGENCSRYLYAEGDIPICLSAHLDSVFASNPHKNVQVDGDIITCDSGLGGDDRVCVYMIFQIIKELRCNVLLLEDEECGHSGAVHFIASPYRDQFIKNNRFCIDLDLSGSNILTFYETTNKEFQQDVQQILPHYEIRDPKQGASDLIELTIGWEKEGRDGLKKYQGTNVASFNIGVGYYNEHTTKEYVNFKEVVQVINDIKQVITNMPDKKYKAQ